jgi:TonB family protein
MIAAAESMDFDPALKNGKPCPAIISLEHQFDKYSKDVDEKSISIGPEEFKLIGLEKNHPERIYSLKLLDSPLKPISRQAPVFPKSAKSYAGEATIEFLVDKEGFVRLPRIISASDQAFAYSAIQAVTNWRFEPPTIKGKSVVVRLRVPFVFKHPK